MNKLRFNAFLARGRMIIPLCLMLWACLPLLHGQNRLDMSRRLHDQTIKSLNTITRDWKGTAQIIYSEDPEIDNMWDPATQQTIPYLRASHAKFIYYKDDREIEVADLIPSSDLLRVTDMEILGDTLYFCGYTQIGFAKSGLIGYFDIPHMFTGRDDVVVKIFNDDIIYDNLEQPEPTVSTIGLIPDKMDVYRVRGGVHIACIGTFSSNHIWNDGYFVADIEHKDSDDSWHYWVHRNTETDWVFWYSDIVATDDYVVLASLKPSMDPIYLTLFKKPSIAESSMFEDRNQLRNYYVFSASLPLSMPRIVHTKGNQFAFAYLQPTEVGSVPQSIFGTTVCGLSINNMTRVQENAVSFSDDESVAIDYGGMSGEPGVVTPHIHEEEQIEGPGGYGDPLAIPVISSSSLIPIDYHGMIGLDTLIYKTDGTSIRDIAYSKQANNVLVLQHTHERNDWAMMNTTINAFPLYDSTLSITEYSKAGTYISAIDTAVSADRNTFVFSGKNDETISPALIAWGHSRIGVDGCLTRSTKEIFHPRRSCFKSVFLFPYIYKEIGSATAAFSTNTYTPNIAVQDPIIDCITEY